MTENKTGLNSSINGKTGAIPSLATEKGENLITLRGFTTSQIWKRKKSSDTPAYCFLRTNKQIADVPTIFRIKENDNWLKPKIKKGSYLQVEGYFSPSDKSRPSFTAYSYQVLENYERYGN